MKKVEQKIEMISCVCGCKQTLNAYDNRNRVRKSLQGHISKKNLIFFKKGFHPPTEFKKGHLTWSKGKKMSEETKKKISEVKKKNPTRYWLGKPRYNMRGTNSNFWTGVNHKTERRKAMESLEYKNWRRSVFTRDNYACVQCGTKGNEGAYLQADHIKMWAFYPELRYDLNNGRTLCLECHKKTPTYGTKYKFIVQ